MVGRRVAVAVVDEQGVVVDAVLCGGGVSVVLKGSARLAPVAGYIARGRSRSRGRTKRSIISWTVSVPLPSSSRREYSASSCGHTYKWVSLRGLGLEPGGRATRSDDGAEKEEGWWE